jgi:7-keto-8-aminopelargonate synthetase-like enzyme
LPSKTQILPLIVGSAEVTSKFAEMLLDYGVYAPAVRPPTVPEGTGRLRISAMATHTTEDMTAAIDAFNAVRLTDNCQSSTS